MNYDRAGEIFPRKAAILTLRGEIWKRAFSERPAPTHGLRRATKAARREPVAPPQTSPAYKCRQGLGEKKEEGPGGMMKGERSRRLLPKLHYAGHFHGEKGKVGLQHV